LHIVKWHIVALVQSDQNLTVVTMSGKHREELSSSAVRALVAAA